MVLIIVYKGVSAGAGRCHVVTGLQEIYRKAAGQYFFQFPSGFHSILAKLLYGENYEQLEGIFGLRIHVVRMKLGDEQIELTDYLTQGGSSIPEDMQSNDLYFQHIAIVVPDMDKAYEHLRKYMFMHVSAAPQTPPAS